MKAYVIAILFFLLILPSISFSAIQTYSSDCTAGTSCVVFINSDVKLKKGFNCTVDVIDQLEDVVQTQVAFNSTVNQKIKTKYNELIAVPLDPMVAGKYILNIECDDSKSYFNEIESLNVVEPKITVFGTDYEVNENMLIFSQLLIDDVPNDNASCVLTMYYPDKSYFLHNVLMTSMGENGLHYFEYDAPNLTGIYMTSIECTYPSLNTSTYTFSSDPLYLDDAYISQQQGNTNYGDNDELIADGAGLVREFLINPAIENLDGISGDLLFAEIELYRSSGSGTQNIWVREINESWNESTVTWNTKPSYREDTYYNLTIYQGDTFFKWDLTESLARYVDNTNTSPFYGWVFQTDSSDEKHFYSSDYDLDHSLRPRGIFVYATPENYTAYAKHVTEIKVNNKLTQINATVINIGDIVDDMCIEFGVCIDDPKFYDYRSDKTGWVSSDMIIIFLLICILITTLYKKNMLKNKYRKMVKK